MFVANFLRSTQVDMSDEYSNFEIVCVDIFTLPTALRVFTAYRPPKSDNTSVVYQSGLMQCIRAHCMLDRVNVITGDFNCPKIDWSCLTSPSDGIHELLLDCVIECGLTQMVDFPTRKNSVLDLILIDEVQRILTILERPSLGQSDHCCVEFSVLVDFACDASDYSSYRYYSWRKADYIGMNNYFTEVDWFKLFCDFPCALDMWSAFIDVIFYAVTLYVPNKVPRTYERSKMRVNHYPSEVRKVFAKKLQHWRKYKVNPDNYRLKLKYQQCAQNCSLLVRRYEQNRESRVIDADNIGAFYRFVNVRLGNKTGISPLHDASGNIILDDQSKADLLNNYFASVGTIDNGMLPPITQPISCVCTLQTVVFTEANVTIATRKLKNNLSCGPDELPPLLFRQTCYSLATPLAVLFTQLISVSAVPDAWKMAIVTPVFKKGLTTDVANYRPISLTCVASKIMERIIVDQMTTFFVDNNIISKTQHGFLKRLSTTTNLLESFNDWTASIQAKKSVTVVYIDFAKAFDTVSHPKLLYRLRQYGIGGCLLSWIQNFLSDRTQTTRVGNRVSAVVDLLSGTIQGSGIGPLLFITYINELADILTAYNVTVKLFADDVKLYAEISTDVNIADFSHALSCIAEWADMWQLQVSVTKCCAIHLNPKYVYSPVKQLAFNGTHLPTHENVRDLGVMVNESLTPSSHIAKITATAHQRVNLIFRTFVSRDITMLLRAYTTYVRPLLEYSTVVWSPSLKQDKMSIEKVQRKFTKRLPGYRNCSYPERRRNLNLMTLELRRLHADLVMCYKIVFSIVMLNFSDFFDFKNSTTRGHPYKLYVSRATSNVRRHFFAHRVVKPWNSLPKDVVDFSSLNRFRNSLHRIDLNSFLMVE